MQGTGHSQGPPEACSASVSRTTFGSAASAMPATGNGPEVVIPMAPFQVAGSGVVQPGSAFMPAQGIAIEEERVWQGSAICPCCEWCTEKACITCLFPYVTFGEVMQRAGLGRCFPHAVAYFAFSIGLFLVCLVVGLLWLPAITLLGIVLMLLGWLLYGGYWRQRFRHKFGIKGQGGCLEDYCLHMWCSTCAVCQEYRTMDHYRVVDGVWQGAPMRGGVLVGQPVDASIVFAPYVQQPPSLSEPMGFGTQGHYPPPGIVFGTPTR